MLAVLAADSYANNLLAFLLNITLLPNSYYFLLSSPRHSFRSCFLVYRVSWNKSFNAASSVYLQPVKHSSTLPSWFCHTFSFSSPLPFPFTMPQVVPDTFRINFKLLLYYACTSHGKAWHKAIIGILFIYLFVMLLFVILYLFITFLGISVAAATVAFSMKLVMSEFWLIQNRACSQAHTKIVQTC